MDAVVVSWANRQFDRQQWTLQQNSAPAHWPKAPQEWSKAHFPDSHLRKRRPTRRISTQWITSFGKFWSPGPVLAPQKFGGSKAVVAAGVVPIVGGRVAAHVLEFSFDAVYWSRRRPVWSKLKVLFTKFFFIVIRWQQYFDGSIIFLRRSFLLWFFWVTL